MPNTNYEPLSAGLILAALNLFPNGALAYGSGTWVSGSAGMGLLSDYQVLFFGLLFQPTVIATFCWFPHGIQNLYEGIAKEDVLESDAELRRSFERLRARLQSP